MKRADKGKKMSTEKQVQQNDLKQSLITYFKGVKAEWSKVSWPTRQQVIAETGVVLVVVAFFTIVVFLMDLIFKYLLGLIK